MSQVVDTNGRRRFVAVTIALVPVFMLLVPAASGSEPLPETIQFDRHVRPILADNCFTCHGPDDAQRDSELRLDTKEGAFIDLGGYRAIVPGEPAASELVRRITAEDEAERMPPAESGRTLTPRQISILKKWIQQGAAWQEHWAFTAPARPTLPEVRDVRWPRNAIDYFILSRLEQQGLRPSPEAGKESLIRRLSLDLIGLPPTPADVDAFMADDSPDAYERVVARLLASPRYGEHMAVAWLDAARYADTSGYQTDGERHMWRWRDWVIDALNRNLPYDRFTIEQLAGDLLPGATLDQHIATGFNRNHRANSEGGIVPEEYLVEYAADRLETTFTVWLGLTIGCARCHDHKYDPMTQREFYQLLSYFNNVPERGRVRKEGNSAPLVLSPTPAMRDRLDAFKRDIVAAKREFVGLQDELSAAQTTWEASPAAASCGDWSVGDALAAHFPLDGEVSDVTDDTKDMKFVGGEAVYQTGRLDRAAQFDGQRYIEAGGVKQFSESDRISIGAWINADEVEAGVVISRMDDNDDAREVGFSLQLGVGKVQVNFGPRWLDDALRIETRSRLTPGRWTHLMVTYDGSQMASGLKIYVDGELQETDVLLDLFTGTFKTPEPLRIGSHGTSGHFRGAIDEVRYYLRELSREEVRVVACGDSIGEIVAVAPEGRSVPQSEKIAAYFLQHEAPQHVREVSAHLKQLRRDKEALQRTVPTTMVMRERPERRETFVLMRGEYDKPGEKVTSGVPACLPPLPADAPNSRLGLATWLVDPANPLTARVAANRNWQTFFGTGLVKTVEDFGTQGDRPTHPALLDWLATELVRSGWDTKAMHRLIVTSATYRQSSQVSEQLLARDPDNRLLARVPRVRLSAETTRDQALSAAGLLSSRLGGPSVKPYQPPGLWKELASQTYTPDSGENLYRRSMYTFWKRTVPPPGMTTFDASSRETCIVRRASTNTPLQVLALLNDVTYVEAARKVAQRMMIEGGSTAAERIQYGFRLVMSRHPSDEELGGLLAAQARYLSRYTADEKAADDLLALGESAPDKTLSATDLAAYTVVASVILNLDETLTRQ